MNLFIYLSKLMEKVLSKIPYFSFFIETKNTQTPITFSLWFHQKILGYNYKAYWPVHHTSVVGGVQNIIAGVETCPGYMPGCYIQAKGKIEIGDYTQISSNVGLISSNHSLVDSRQHKIDEIIIGKYCWIGMGAVILPGVVLGDFTVVGAGSIVTKSFENGHVVIAGNPAKIIKEIDHISCVPFKSEFEYNGYIKSSKFDTFRKENLKH